MHREKYNLLINIQMQDREIPKINFLNNNNDRYENTKIWNDANQIKYRSENQTVFDIFLAARAISQ